MPPFLTCFLTCFLTWLFPLSILSHAHKERKEGTGVEGEEWVEIGASAVYGFVGDKQNGDPYTADQKADKVCDLYEDHKTDAHKFKGIAKLVASLCEIGNGDECHIKNDLGDQPSDADGKITIGAPVVEGAKVVGEVVSHVKGDKVIVFKKKRRKGYRVRNGHRQCFTELVIKEVVA